jgi:hypothetical protein
MTPLRLTVSSQQRGSLRLRGVVEASEDAVGGDGVMFERFPCLCGAVEELPVPCGSHPELGRDGFFFLAGPGWVCCFEVEQLLRVDHAFHDALGV